MCNYQNGIICWMTDWNSNIIHSFSRFFWFIKVVHKIMTGFFSQENNTVASWFFSPRGENGDYVHEFYYEIIDKQMKAWKDYYFPNDPLFITKDMKESDEFKANMKSLKRQLDVIYLPKRLYRPGRHTIWPTLVWKHLCQVTFAM